MTWRVALLACLALALGLGVRWLMPSDRSATPPVTMPDTRFDYTLSDYSASFRDAENHVELTLSGPRLEHVWAERVAHLDAPKFHIEPGGADWRGQADAGQVMRDDELLVLEGNIVLVHRDPAGAIEVRAELLRYDRRARTISSTRPVAMEQAGSFVESGGLNIDLQTNILELTDGVQGELEPSVVPAADRRGDAGSDGGSGPGG